MTEREAHELAELTSQHRAMVEFPFHFGLFAFAGWLVSPIGFWHGLGMMALWIGVIFSLAVLGFAARLQRGSKELEGAMARPLRRDARLFLVRVARNYVVAAAVLVAYMKIDHSIVVVFHNRTNLPVENVAFGDQRIDRIEPGRRVLWEGYPGARLRWRASGRVVSQEISIYFWGKRFTIDWDGNLPG